MALEALREESLCSAFLESIPFWDELRKSIRKGRTSVDSVLRHRTEENNINNTLDQCSNWKGIDYNGRGYSRAYSHPHSSKQQPLQNSIWRKTDCALKSGSILPKMVFGTLHVYLPTARYVLVSSHFHPPNHRLWQRTWPRISIRVYVLMRPLKGTLWRIMESSHPTLSTLGTRSPLQWQVKATLGWS